MISRRLQLLSIDISLYLVALPNHSLLTVNYWKITLHLKLFLIVKRQIGSELWLVMKLRMNRVIISHTRILMNILYYWLQLLLFLLLHILILYRLEWWHILYLILLLLLLLHLLSEALRKYHGRILVSRLWLLMLNIMLRCKMKLLRLLLLLRLRLILERVELG